MKCTVGVRDKSGDIVGSLPCQKDIRSRGGQHLSITHLAVEMDTVGLFLLSSDCVLKFQLNLSNTF